MGKTGTQRHSSRQPTRHDGEPWATPSKQPHQPIDDPMQSPTGTPGLVLGPPPALRVTEVDLNTDSDIDVRSVRSDRANSPCDAAANASPIAPLPAVDPAPIGSSGTRSAKYSSPGPYKKVVCGYGTANLDRAQANAGRLARAHVATDPASSSSTGRPWWATYGEMADWSVPQPALLRDPDTWTYEAFHDAGDIVHLPYDMLGLGEYPACFFCRCSLLVRRKDPPEASK